MLFFQLVNARHERASTVLTSNKGFEEWGRVLGGEVMAAAQIDLRCDQPWFRWTRRTSDRSFPHARSCRMATSKPCGASRYSAAFT